MKNQATIITSWSRGIALVALAGLGVGCGRPAPVETSVPRPIKSMVVSAIKAEVERNLPGKVLAGRKVTLSFEVGGTIIERPFRIGESVAAGAVLARLDPRDYQNTRDAAAAELERAEAQFERVQIAAELNAVSQQDLSDARAAREIARAQLAIKQKALEDTVLKAPFAGKIADRFVDVSQFIQPREAILNFQDDSQIDLEVFAPEAAVAAIPRDRLGQPDPRVEIEAIFDFLPGVAFPVTFKEISTEADPVTQTYRLVVTMAAPEQYSILPGMGGTIRARVTARADQLTEGFLIPLDAVPVDGATGQYAVWVLQPSADGLATAHRRTVEVGAVIGDSILVRRGLAANDRIALVGVHVLQENQVVRPLEAGEDRPPS